MPNFLYFSDHIKPLAKRIRFLLIVCGRFFIVLFKLRKGIRLLHLDYEKKHLFDNSYLVIRYRFRNALWYNFKKIGKTTEKEIIVLSLKNVPKVPIELIVYGFFRSKIFLISVTPEHRLQNSSFKTVIKGAGEIEIYNKPIVLKGVGPKPKIPQIKLKPSEIQIKQPTYNQTDFI